MNIKRDTRLLPQGGYNWFKIWNTGAGGIATGQLIPYEWSIVKIRVIEREDNAITLRVELAEIREINDGAQTDPDGSNSE